MIEKTYYSLLKATQVNRVHPREVQPPALVRARNFIPSQSDLALTLRPNIADYGTTLYTMSAFQSVADYLNSMILSQKSANKAWINRITPMEDGVNASLSSTYTTGTVTVSGTTVTGVGTSWLANVWPHCWISVDSGSTYHRVKEVVNDTTLKTYATPGSASGATYTIIRTHDYERADFPVHIEPFVNSHIYNSVSPTTSDHDTTISGPFRSPLEVLDSAWTVSTVGAIPAAETVGGGGVPELGTYYLNAVAGDSGSPENIVVVGRKIKNFTGQYAVILESSDRAAWTERLAVSGYYATGLNAVAYSGGLWVAVGEKGLIYTSTDRTTWTERTGVTDEYGHKPDYYGIAYGAGLWVAVGSFLDRAFVATSPDGVTWTQRLLGYTWHQDVRKLFVGATLGDFCGNIYQYWKIMDSGTLGKRLNAVAYNSTRFVAVGTEGCVMTSTDGIEWTETFTQSVTEATIPARYFDLQSDYFEGWMSQQPDWTLNGVAWDSTNSKWLICGQDKDYTTGAFNSVLAYATTTAASFTQITLTTSSALNAISFNSTPAYAVAVGNSLAYKIASGTTATVATSGVTSTERGVYYSTEWVAVGDANLLSPDGLVWINAGSGPTPNYYTSHGTASSIHAFGVGGYALRSYSPYSSFSVLMTGVDASKTIYASHYTATAPSIATPLHVIAGESGTVATSADGMTWTAQTSGITKDIYGLTIKNDNSRYVAVGEDGIIYTCDDEGVTWVAQTTENPAKGTITFTGLPSAGQTFTIDTQTFTWVVSGTATGNVVVGGTADECVTNVVTSVTRDLATVTAEDGTGSTVVITAAAAGAAGNAIVFADVDSANMTVDGSGTLGATQAGQDAITEDFRSVARNTTMFVAVATGGKIVTSADGVLWTERTSGVAVDLRAVIWGGTTSKWVAVGAEVCLYSTDGITWATSATSVTGVTFNALATDATNYLAVGNSGEMWSSANGTTWTERTSGQTVDYNTCGYIGSTWWALGENGLVSKATALTSWARQNVTNPTPSLYDVWKASNGQMVAVGDSGAIYKVTATSSTKVYDTPGVDFRGVHSTDGTTWVMVGKGGVIYTTTDFSTWTLETSGVTNDLYSVAHDGTNYIAVGASGTILYSSDLSTWAAGTTTSSDLLRKVRVGGGMVYAVGQGGDVLSSDDHGETWATPDDLNVDLWDLAYDSVNSPAAIAAVGTITMPDPPSFGETFVIDTQTFTWVASRSGVGEVTLDVDDRDVCAANIVTAVTADLSTVTAVATDNTVAITAVTAGTAGNAIVFTESSDYMEMDGSGFLGGTTLGVATGQYWVAVSADGSVFYTTDGFSTSTHADSGINSSLLGCLFIAGRWWAVGGDGTIYTTTNLANEWTKLQNASGYTLYSVCWDGTYLIAVGAWAGTQPTIVSHKNNAALETFVPLSDIYRSNVFAVVDGYVILFGTSEYNSSKKIWEWQRRRIRWTAPGTYNDFATEEQAGFADVFGEGNFLDARTLGHSVIIWESSNISILSQTGVLESPWEYRVIEWSNRMISNPVVINDVAYWIEASGLLYRSNGVTVEPVPSGFDITQWTDYDTATPLWLTYDETSGCLVIFKPVTTGTPVCYFYSPILDAMTECSIPPASRSDARYPQSIITVGGGQGLPTLMVGYTTDGGYPTYLVVGKFNYGAAITGVDNPGYGADSVHWHGEIQTGVIKVVGTGEKTAVRALVAKTYQDAATMRWAFSGRGSDEDSWSGASDTQGTISVTTSAVAGTSTMFSSLLGTSTGSETVYTGAVIPAWAWNVVVTNGADVVQTTPAYTVTGAYEITFTDALTSGWKVYAYWDADPSPFMAVGDVIETSEGFHEILTIPDRASATLAWYPSTTLSGTHWHTDTPASGEKEAYAGFPLLVDSLQARIIVVPTASSTATKVKLLGFEVRHQAAGPRQMVR